MAASVFAGSLAVGDGSVPTIIFGADVVIVDVADAFQVCQVCRPATVGLPVPVGVLEGSLAVAGGSVTTIVFGADMAEDTPFTKLFPVIVNVADGCPAPW